jgi:hypothetical protein
MSAAVPGLRSQPVAEKARISPPGYSPDYERERLVDLFVGRYGGMLRAVHGLLTRALNRDMPPPDAVAMRHILLEARARAVKVDATTQFAIAAMLADGVRRGLSAEEIANGTADFPGIEGLFEKTWRGRSKMIARTELQNAQLRASVDRFRTFGIKWVRARDGDYDAACAARNGKVYPISNPPELNHPNCRLTVAPTGGP